VDRRKFVKVAGATVAVGTTGCLHGGGNGGDDGEEDGGDDGSDDGGDTGGEDGGDGMSGIEGYVEGANNYDGEVQDMTGEDSVTVSVGAGNGLAFDPVAIEISPGTTVTWEWTGEGGAHNVVAEDESFDSGSAKSGSDVTFEHSFEEAGDYNYYCTPHKSAGMLGGIRVVEE
jgi:halocyanin-like protein